MKSRTDKDIDKAFDAIERDFEKTQKKDKYLKYSLLKPIHDKYPFAQNGICAFIANVGSGKTYNYLKLMKQQEVLFDDAFFELIVICSTSSKFDATVKAFKPLIKKSKIIAIKDTDLLDFLNKYMRRLLKFNALNKYMTDKKDIDEELKRIADKHKLKLDSKKVKDVERVIKYVVQKIEKYGWRSFPHRMLLIMDDFASHPLLRSKENELPRLLKKLRHFFINVIICVQTVKSIPKDLKRTLSDLVIFGGISKEDFYDLMREIPLGPYDIDELFKQYKTLTNKHSTMRFHLTANRIIINEAKNKD